MSDEVFLKGDPATDSTRRHMERVLNAQSHDNLRKAAVAGAAAWGIWRLFRVFAAGRRKNETKRQQPH